MRDLGLHSPELANVHQALNQAAFVTGAKPPGIPTSFRLEEGVRQFVTDVCLRHGTSLSEYLRQSCMLLAKDYGYKPCEVSNTSIAE